MSFAVEGHTETVMEKGTISYRVILLDSKGRFTLCVTFPFRHRFIFVPSDYAAKLDDVDEFSCADSDARAEAELASQRHLEY